MIKRRSKNVSRFTSTDEDPMSGLANLADVMLVFSCGLLVALAVYWNVSMNVSQTEVIEKDQLSESVDMDKLLSSKSEGKGLYVYKGDAYEDPSTGKMYILEKIDKDEDISSTSSTDSTNSNNTNDSNNKNNSNNNNSNNSKN